MPSRGSFTRRALAAPMIFLGLTFIIGSIVLWEFSRFFDTIDGGPGRSLAADIWQIALGVLLTLGGLWLWRPVPAPDRWRALVVLIVAVCGCLVIAGNTRALLLRYGLVHRDGVDLVYPGAEIVLRGDGYTDTRMIVRSDASTDSIARFYRTYLDTHGYAFQIGIPTTRELYACGWRNDEQTVRLAFLDPDEFPDYFGGQNAQKTVYTWTIKDGAPGTFQASRPCDILMEGDPPPP